MPNDRIGASQTRLTDIHIKHGGSSTEADEQATPLFNKPGAIHVIRRRSSNRNIIHPPFTPLSFTPDNAFHRKSVPWFSRQWAIDKVGRLGASQEKWIPYTQRLLC